MGNSYCCPETNVTFRGLQPIKGKNGATFQPYIEDGWLKWTNDGGLPNPEPYYIGGGGGSIPTMSVEQAMEGTDPTGMLISPLVLQIALESKLVDVIELAY